MKIAIFSWEALHACVIGGVSAHVSGLGAALVRLGHEVHLFTREAPGHRAEDLIGGVYYHRCPWKRQDVFLDEVRAFNHSLTHYFLETADRIGGFDVIHCHDWLTFPAALRLRDEDKLGAGCRWIATFHTTEWGRSGKWPESGEGQRIARWEQGAVDGADAVLCVSEEIRRQVDLLYNCPLWKKRIIYHGISTPERNRLELERGSARAALGLSPAEPTALFVGSLTEQKGADVLIDSLESLFATAPEARLVIAGGGALLPRLQETLLALHREHQAIFAPTEEPWQIARLYPASDVVAIPYRYDPFGIVALSAWAAAKPFVLCGNGTAAEFICDELTGLKTTPDAFGETLGALLNDPKRARWLGNNGRAACRTAFSWESVAQRTLEMYRGDNERAWRDPDAGKKADGE